MAEKILNKENFEKEVLKAKKPVLVDFWAPWCGPCRMLSPIIEKFAEDYDGKYVVGKVNVDENPELAEEYGVMSIPFLAAFKDGKLTGKKIGVTGEEGILDLLDKN